MSNQSIPQNVNFSVKDFFSKCRQIRRKLRICSHLLKKYSTEKFTPCEWIILDDTNTRKSN